MNEAKVLWNQLLSRWHQLSQREQWLSMGGGVSIFIWLIWQGIVAPLDERQQQAEKQLAASKVQLATIQQQACQIVNLRASGARETADTTRPMDQIVHESARRFQIEIQRVQSKGSMLDIDLGDLAFSKLLQWLVEMEQQFGIEVRDIQLGATAVSGAVEVSRLQLERS